ncbi:hypothetical protein, partial [Parabacteroides sp.]
NGGAAAGGERRSRQPVREAADRLRHGSQGVWRAAAHDRQGYQALREAADHDRQGLQGVWRVAGRDRQYKILIMRSVC